MRLIDSNALPAPREEQLRVLARETGVLRARDLDSHGIARAYLKPLIEQGVLLQVGRGLYALAEAKDDEQTRAISEGIQDEHQTLIEAMVRVPYGVVCLASALRYHGLTTQNPWQVWLLVDARKRIPKVDYPPLLFFQASGAAFTEGIETHAIPGRENMADGRSLRVTSIPKTIADCFKYRNKVGVDVAMEALKQCLLERRTTREEIRRFARLCRVEKVMQPYMEAFSL